MSLVFLYVVCNKHFNKPAKNQTLSRAFPEFMVKKRSRGQPTLTGKKFLRLPTGESIQTVHTVMSLIMRLWILMQVG